MNLLNLVGYVLALLLAVGGVLLVSRPATAGTDIHAVAVATAVRDARGTDVQVLPWRRIVSLDLVSDEMLGHLVEPDRIVAVSRWVQGPEAWRHSGKPRLDGLNDLEAVLHLKPDLVLVSTFGGETDRIQRLRDGGLAVFDLGPAGGLRELCGNLRRIGALVGAAARGERLAAQLEQRMAAVAARLPVTRLRRRGLVLTPVVDQVYGGTTGSSFHDILVSAGLIDIAACRYVEPWPRIGAEAALAMDPDLIVTRQGATAELLRIPGFERLRAVRAGAVVELPVELFDSPGLSMLDAAELLYGKAYP
jgi:iron complex transport system substrate-binding protein